jgi:hypothetical protein
VTSDQTRPLQGIWGIAEITLGKATYGGVLLAMVVFGLFKDLLS